MKFQIIGACIEVHRILGSGFQEVIYKDAMELEFIERSISFLRDGEYSVSDKGQVLRHKFFCRFYRIQQYNC